MEGSVIRKKEQLTNLLTTQDINDDNVRSIAGNDIPSVWLGISPEGDYGEETIQTEGSLDDKSTRKKQLTAEMQI